MINRSLAVRDRAMSAPSVPEPSAEAGSASLRGAGSGELRPPLALWIYVARGLGRIILSVLALPFV
jgi:hypothetical protein